MTDQNAKLLTFVLYCEAGEANRSNLGGTLFVIARSVATKQSREGGRIAPHFFREAVGK
jgi:hypothetical protein